MHKRPFSANPPAATAILFRSILAWAIAAILALAAASIAQTFALPKTAAGQMASGLFGFGGGWSQALLVKGRGMKIPWTRGIVLSMVWALVCIGGVTPLFLVTGTAVTMEILALYSFAACGAMGGMATAIVIRPLLSNTPPPNVIPSALIWSFSFGTAAVAGDILGEGLQPVFPPLMAWAVASGIAVVIIGCGGGFSVIHSLTPEKARRAMASPVFSGESADPLDATRKNGIYIWTIVLLCVPFYLNDFSNIYITDWRLWLLIDYTAVKLFPFVVVVYMVHTHRMALSEFGWVPQKATPFLSALFLGTLIVTFILQNGDLLLDRLPGYSPLGKMPVIASPIWRWIDLTIGLLMVGIFEELVFRGYLLTFISRYTRRTSVIIFVSATAFGLIHWSGGLHAVALTGIAGAVFMFLYLQTRSLPAIMLAHFAVNVIDTLNLLPRPVIPS